MSEQHELAWKIFADLKAGGSSVMRHFYDRYSEDRMSVPEHWRLFFELPENTPDLNALIRSSYSAVNFSATPQVDVMKPKDDEAFRLYLDGE